MDWALVPLKVTAPEPGVKAEVETLLVQSPCTVIPRLLALSVPLVRGQVVLDRQSVGQ